MEFLCFELNRMGKSMTLEDDENVYKVELVTLENEKIRKHSLLYAIGTHPVYQRLAKTMAEQTWHKNSSIYFIQRITNGDQYQEEDTKKYENEQLIEEEEKKHTKQDNINGVLPEKSDDTLISKICNTVEKHNENEQLLKFDLPDDVGRYNFISNKNESGHNQSINIHHVDHNRCDISMQNQNISIYTDEITQEIKVNGRINKYLSNFESDIRESAKRDTILPTRFQKEMTSSVKMLIRIFEDNKNEEMEMENSSCDETIRPVDTKLLEDVSKAIGALSMPIQTHPKLAEDEPEKIEEQTENDQDPTLKPEEQLIEDEPELPNITKSTEIESDTSEPEILNHKEDIVEDDNYLIILQEVSEELVIQQKQFQERPLEIHTNVIEIEPYTNRSLGTWNNGNQVTNLSQGQQKPLPHINSTDNEKDQVQNLIQDAINKTSNDNNMSKLTKQDHYQNGPEMQTSNEPKEYNSLKRYSKSQRVKRCIDRTPSLKRYKSEAELYDRLDKVILPKILPKRKDNTLISKIYMHLSTPDNMENNMKSSDVKLKNGLLFDNYQTNKIVEKIRTQTKSTPTENRIILENKRNRKLTEGRYHAIFDIHQLEKKGLVQTILARSQFQGKQVY